MNGAGMPNGVFSMHTCSTWIRSDPCTGPLAYAVECCCNQSGNLEAFDLCAGPRPWPESWLMPSDGELRATKGGLVSSQYMQTLAGRGIAPGIGLQLLRL